MEPKEVVRRFVQEYQEKRDPRAFAQFLSPAVVDHTPMAGTAGGAEGVRQIFDMLWSALPDMRVEVHDQIAEGDKVVTRKSFVGTHGGALLHWSSEPPSRRLAR
jgi:predicted ester cyclase